MQILKFNYVCKVFRSCLGLANLGLFQDSLKFLLLFATQQESQSRPRRNWFPNDNKVSPACGRKAVQVWEFFLKFIFPLSVRLSTRLCSTQLYALHRETLNSLPEAAAMQLQCAGFNWVHSPAGSLSLPFLSLVTHCGERAITFTCNVLCKISSWSISMFMFSGCLLYSSDQESIIPTPGHVYYTCQASSGRGWC